MNVQKIPAPSLECGEGAIWDAGHARFLWTDAMDRAVYVADENGTSPVLLFTQAQVGSIALHRGGGLVFGGAEGVCVWTGGGDVRWLAREAAGRPVRRINELLADPVGGVFAAQEVYEEDKSYVPGCLFRFEPGGGVSVIEEGVHVGNGMAFSPDQRVFYFTESVHRVIYAYDYSVADGSIKNRRAVVRLPVERGLPDGLAVDSQGYLWTACWFGGGVARYDPEGKQERFIPLPVAQVSSVAFGGSDLTTLWATSAAVQWKTKLAPPGHDYTYPRGGSTFRIEQDIVGRVEFLAAV